VRGGRLRVGCLAAIGAVIVCWAYSPIGIRIGLRAYEPGQLALIRFVIASAFLAAVALVARISLPKPRDIPLFMVLGFFAVTLHHLCLNAAQPYVTAGASSVLTQSTPIFSAMLGRFVLGERVTRWRWACVGVGMVGAFVVVTAGGSAKTLNWHATLVLLAALSWSIYFTLQRHHARHYGALEMTCYTVWSGTLFLSIYSPGLVDRAIHAPMGVNLAVGILGVFPSALAYLWWAKVLERMDVSTAAPALYLVPPVSMIMASVALNERTPAAVIVGAVIVICSVLLVNLEYHRITLRTRFNVLGGNSVNGE